MIEARPSQIVRRLAVAYFRRRARIRIAGIYGASMERLKPWNQSPASDAGSPGPLIIVANHSSWWDAVMPILISLDHCDHDAYGIMEERELEKYRFFARVGMFSIDRDNPRSAMRSLRYGAELLRGTNRVLWFYPQGEIVPAEVRPLQIERGIAHLVRMSGTVTVLPVALRYELLKNERPDVWMRCGEALEFDESNSVDTDLVVARIREGLEGVMNQVQDDLIGRECSRYEKIFSGGRSISDRWDRVRGR